MGRGPAMRIAVASDHAGWSFKEELKEILTGHDVSDFGTKDSAACDLSDFVYPAALAVGEEQVDRGDLRRRGGLRQRADREQGARRVRGGLPGPVLRNPGTFALRHERALPGRQDHRIGPR